MESKVIVVVGPTCSGKTDLSLHLGEKLNSEIISSDSRQLYKYLNIGTAKPTEVELSRIKHHLIDFLDPNEEYNASKFENDALQIISSLHSENIIPIAAGGSGLYIKALVDGIFDSVDTDEEYRAEIMAERLKFGNKYLYDKLLKIDPKTANNLLPQNWKRIIRALEVFHITGEPIWKHQEEHSRNLNIEFRQYGLDWNRKILYSNIEKRVDQMIENGLIDEVQSLLDKGFEKKLNSLNTVGYKEIIEYLDGEITIERAVELIKRNTRRYAKRQMTWFRKDERIKWYNVESKETFPDIAADIVNDL